jgi:chromosome segregation ATPase
MKKILFAALAGLFLVACNSVAKYETPIQSLSTQWDSTATVVGNFAALVGQEIQNAQNMQAGMQLPEDVTKKMKEEQLGKMQELQASFQAQSNVLTEINNEVNAFVATWDEKGQSLTGLKDGLAAGKLNKDVDATISELQTVVSDAGSKVAAWTEKLNAAKEQMQALAMQSGELLQ